MARWKPQRQETYYFIDQYLRVKSFYWWEEKEDNKLYNVGNCFQTKEQAELAMHKLRETLINFHKEISNNG
jgi:hypothetical protein